MNGKIKSIDKSAGSDLEFAYDATGQRIMKKVTPTSGPIIYTYYARDAQGNVMAAYTREEEGETNSLVLSELHVYGSSRIGIISTEKNVGVGVGDPTFGPKYSRYLGEKRYELVNHLGNVLEVITDRRFQIQETATGYTHTVKYYEPDVVSMQDYDPFGMITVGRNWEVGSHMEYRFSFSGYEKNNEIIGENNMLDFGARIYDARLGKFLSIDNFAYKYPGYSPYSYAGNSPLYLADKEGDSIFIYLSDDKNKTKPIMVIVTNEYNAEVVVPWGLYPHEPVSMAPYPYNTQYIYLDNLGIDFSGAGADAFEVSIDYEWVAVGGMMFSFDFIMINDGVDDGGMFLYFTKAGGVGWSQGVGITAGPIDFNEESGEQLDRNTFKGNSQVLSGSIGLYNGERVTSYKEGELCLIPLYDCGLTKLYNAELEGIGTPGTGIGFYKAESTLLKTLKQPDKKDPIDSTKKQFASGG